jgi:hypothetical protein
MSTTYYESAEGQQITRSRAIHEVRDHGSDVAEFIAEMGDYPIYDAQEVLSWLGY